MLYFRSLIFLPVLVCVLPLLAAGPVTLPTNQSARTAESAASMPTVQGSHAVQLTVMSFSTMSRSMQTEIGWQQFIADQTALRLGAALTAQSGHGGFTSFLLNGGIAKYTAPVGPISLYYGGTLGLGNSVSHNTIGGVTATSTTTILQLLGNLGGEYFFQPRASIGVDFSLGFVFGFDPFTTAFGNGTTAVRASYYL